MYVYIYIHKIHKCSHGRILFPGVHCEGFCCTRCMSPQTKSYHKDIAVIMGGPIAFMIPYITPFLFCEI